jgi:hypothetical protein
MIIILLAIIIIKHHIIITLTLSFTHSFTHSFIHSFTRMIRLQFDDDVTDVPPHLRKVWFTIPDKLKYIADLLYDITGKFLTPPEDIDHYLPPPPPPCGDNHKHRLVNTNTNSNIDISHQNNRNSNDSTEDVKFHRNYNTSCFAIYLCYEGFALLPHEVIICEYILLIILLSYKII